MGAMLDQTTISIQRRPGVWSATTGAWIPTVAALSVSFEITGTPLEGENFSITIDGVYGNNYAPAGATPETTAAALRSRLPGVFAALDVTVSGSGAFVVITSDVASADFAYSSDTDSVGAAIVEAVVQARTPPDPFSVVASAPQPVGPETIEMIPEGARASARYLIYVPDGQAEIILIDSAGANASDHAQYDGREFLIASIDNWQSRPLGYKGYALLEVSDDE